MMLQIGQMAATVPVRIKETVMPKGYHHLTYADRCQIKALSASGLSRAAIARRLGRDPSTISRELL